MKKSTALIVAMICIALPGLSQQEKGFKSYEKKLPGTAKHDLIFKNISGSTGLKSAIGTAKSPISPKLMIPEQKGNDQIKKIIRVSGSPVYFEKTKINLKSGYTVSTEGQFFSFFDATKSITGLTDPAEELKITQISTDAQGITHIRAQQVYHGIEVFGAESYLHIGKDKDIFTGRIVLVNPQIRIDPAISEDNALAKLKSDIGTKTLLRELSDAEKAILDYSSPEVTLVIYEGKLAYKITIRPNFIEEWRYFINAISGEILFSYNNTYSDGPATANAFDLNNISRTINTYLENGTYWLIDASEPMYNPATNEGRIVTLDANNTSSVELDYHFITSDNNTWTIPAGVSAHYNAKKTYDYLRTTFNRNSLNDQGGNIISFINVSEEDGSSMENAFWNGKAVFYGNGGSAFKPLPGALDVAAHELGHGVISNTANLEYWGQSGAVNESYADIFGSMVDREDWYIGEDVTKTSFSPSGRLRDMSDPHNWGSSLDDPYWQPGHVSEMYLGEQDNGGVHINSGIGNHAYYLFAKTTSKEIAEQVFYKALTDYLTSRSQFIDFRIAVIQSAKDLYGEASNEVSAAKNAFDAVGIYDEEPVSPEQELPVNPGSEYLLVYNTYSSDLNTLYRVTSDGQTFEALTTTVLKRRPGVSDDGSYALFVSDDDLIRALYTDPYDPQESVLSDEAFWDNVTISKDGNRVAAISTEIDTAIYIFDYQSQEWGVFKLYNPTTSDEGITAGGVIYADAIEFDNTGEYLIYDAYNVLYSSTGEDISYWDIGFIKVWDNATNYFGDGSIQKLYGSLPENVSIGNPTFSKNSPHIIAFDYYNSSTEEYAIWGMNLITGDLDLITENSTIGFPSYSRDDDMIAFSALDIYNDEVVGVISLDENKITGVGDATVFVGYAKWPVFYAEGSRNLELPPVANFTADIKSGGAPLSVQFLDLSKNKPVSWSWSFPGGNPVSSDLQNPVVVYNTPGTYQVSLTCSNNSGNDAVTKTDYIYIFHTGTESRIKELIKYYPNPTVGILYIESDIDFRLTISDIGGKVLINKSNMKEIDLSAWHPGIYIMKLEIDGNIFTDKIIRQ